jgi:hypothetical protein
VSSESRKPAKPQKTLDRREFPRLKGAFKVRYGVCGTHGRQIPGFTEDMGIGGIRLLTPSSDAVIGDHIAVEIAVPGYEAPLYFLGQVVRHTDTDAGTELAIRFDYLGKSDDYKAMLIRFLEAHGAA